MYLDKVKELSQILLGHPLVFLINLLAFLIQILEQLLDPSSLTIGIWNVPNDGLSIKVDFSVQKVDLMVLRGFVLRVQKVLWKMDRVLLKDEGLEIICVAIVEG